jgi:hypothetical protein
MKTIIAGSRWITNYDVVCQAIEESGFEITEVVSGTANGADTLGENWAEANDVPVKPFPADWKNLKVKGAVIRQNKYGKYNAAAGHLRNERMAKYGEALIALWDGVSRGTASMITLARKYELKVYIFMVDEVEATE